MDRPAVQNGSPTVTAGGAGPPAGAARVRGWKEIGRWFGVDERTVKRWEAARGLPVHRVPGDARAPVFAYDAELAAWLRSRGTGDDAPAPAAAAPDPAVATPAAPEAPRRRPALLLIAVVALALAAWQGWRLAEARRQSSAALVADVRQLARGQIAALNDRLERQPRTVRLRAALAREAAAVLGRVAALPDASAGLRLEAAEAWRRLAIVESAIDRPSLRNRAAARAALDRGLALIAGLATPAAGRLRAQLLIDAARHAAADGAVAAAPALLAAARRAAPQPPPALAAELALAASEVAQWQGDYAGAIAAATPVIAPPPAAGIDGWLRQVRARDLVAEARYYAGDLRGARAGYREALAVAMAARARLPDEPALRWAVLRQQWNFGSTLAAAGDAAAALPPLAASLAGWHALAAADPEDEALAAWVRTTRLSYGEALAAAGRGAEAIGALSQSVADRRAWVAAAPASAERQRALVVGLAALADALAGAGRRGEACALYAEAAGIGDAMARAGTLTRLDRDAMLAPLGAARARWCDAA